jgi:hypothetical protein
MFSETEDLIANLLMMSTDHTRCNWLRSSLRCIASLALLLPVYQSAPARSVQSAQVNNGASGATLVRVPLTLREAVQVALKQNPDEMVARI